MNRTAFRVGGCAFFIKNVYELIRVCLGIARSGLGYAKITLSF